MGEETAARVERARLCPNQKTPRVIFRETEACGPLPRPDTHTRRRCVTYHHIRCALASQFPDAVAHEKKSTSEHCVVLGCTTGSSSILCTRTAMKPQPTRVVLETATSSRSSCRTCKTLIFKGERRFCLVVYVTPTVTRSMFRCYKCGPPPVRSKVEIGRGRG